MLLDAALARESTRSESEDAWDSDVAAQGLLAAAQLLDGRYHLVVTNVPYLARGKQCDALKDYCASHYPAAKNDLANVRMPKILDPESCVKEKLPNGVRDSSKIIGTSIGSKSRSAKKALACSKDSWFQFCIIPVDRRARELHFVTSL